MSASTRERIAESRRQNSAVRRYLQHVRAGKRGRGAEPETLRKRIERTRAAIEACDDLLQELELRQQIIDLEKRLAATEDAPGSFDLEEAFVKEAGNYSARTGVGWKAFRQMGVPAAVLRRAGIPYER